MYSLFGLGCTMDGQIREGSFCRVRNRIDIVGKVIKIDGNFVCLDVPQFRGNLEYPMSLVELIETNNFYHPEGTVMHNINGAD